MKIRVKSKWVNVLDSYLFDDSVRIAVLTFANLKKINNQYFVRKKSLLKVYYYIFEIGLVPTLRKILSRFRETYRNEKYFSIGFGYVMEKGSEVDQVEVGDRVFFIAPNHPCCPTRVALNKYFVFLDAENALVDFKEGELLYFSKNRLEKEDDWYENLIAWSRYSGKSAADIVSNHLVNKIKYTLLSLDQEYVERTLIEHSEIICDTSSHTEVNDKKSAVLFGFGNYAKTCILPNLHKDILVSRIHEIDPMQLLPMEASISYNTSPVPSESDIFDVFLISGYHHTHAAIAIAGLNQSADVVVEKPLVTTLDQLDKLVAAMKQSTGKLYACFQKRYHKFNKYIYHDLGIQKGDAISYHAIVYEEALPDLHWYRWPNSKSAIISNGCHWIDHFFFLNNYSQPLSYSAKKLKTGVILVDIELENSAVFSMVLSHQGSARIGVQEYIELRAKEATIKMTNSTYYLAESTSKIIRRTKENKYNAYRNMYKNISEAIVCDKHISADSWKNVYLVSKVALDLDAAISNSN